MLAATRGAFTAFRSSVARPATRGLVAPAIRPMEQSSFLGTSAAPSSLVRAPARGSLVVMAAKTSMGCNISGKGSNKKRRTTSGFMARNSNPNGKNVLKARRKKGRAVLCPASQKKSGGKK